MRAHRVKVTIPEDHQLQVKVSLPPDFSPGAGELIVLAPVGAEAKRREEALAAIAELRSIQLTPYEQEVLDGFEDFQREHPFSLHSLREDE